ncbi:hypothetical protein SKAU_G00035840 [Synaphobranchus kaupii]|uniref:Uncharacterized protein n=1 Tax=Synaphobranchus kaupii TaxID=118154 RepID=A0A9Q1GG35_SYNKA|nr:hypothetical protein SKAU_G00035840 [Synaphobranchus kaupii]
MVRARSAIKARTVRSTRSAVGPQRPPAGPEGGRRHTEGPVHSKRVGVNAVSGPVVDQSRTSERPLHNGCRYYLRRRMALRARPARVVTPAVSEDALGC